MPKPEKSPAYPFYVNDFFQDHNVLPMDDATVGVYVRLMGIAWNAGSIPADPTLIQALLPKTKPRDFARMWPMIAKCWVQHPDRVGALIQPRLEKERQKQAEYKERQAAAGRKGGKARSSGAQAVLKQALSGVKTGLKLSLSTSPSKLATLAESAREQDRFAHWFVTRGITVGAIPAHVEAVPEEHLAIAGVLIEYHGEDAVRAASERLFARKLNTAHPKGELLASASLATLASKWDWFDHDEPASTKGVMSDGNRSYLDDLLAQEATAQP